MGSHESFTAPARYVTVRDQSPGPWCVLGRMPEHVSIFQLLGVGLLALLTVAWVIGLALVLRASRPTIAPWPTGPALPALPHQRQAPPHLESVQLTPAEQDAFAGLVRRLSDGR